MLNIPAPITPFLAGWNSLPDELKLEILKCTVPSGEIYTSWHFAKIVRKSEKQAVLELRQTVFPSLSCFEIKELVLEAFYGQNTMVLRWGVPLISPQGVTCIIPYPPPAVRSYIRHITTALFQTTARTLTDLSNVADQTRGFARLRSVELIISGGVPPYCYPDSYASEVEALRGYLNTIDQIAFSGRRLEVTYLHDPYKKTDEFELLVLNKLTLRGRPDKVQQEWARYYYEKDNTSKKVDTWHTIDTNYRSKMTEKIVSI